MINMLSHLFSRSATRVCILFFLLFCSFNAGARIIVTDAKTGEPLPRASIFDNKGLFIGVADEEGVIPASITASSFPLNIRYIGYEPAIAQSTDAVVALNESSYELPEIVVNNVDRNMLHIIAYERVFSSGMDNTDTLNYFTERIVDFMIPLNKKTKYKGWKKSRVLAERNYRHIKRDRKDLKVDTLTYSENKKSSSGTSYDLSDTYIIPEELLSGKATKMVIDGKYYPEDTWTVIGDNYFLYRDNLADEKDHVMSPGILKALGMTTDFTKYEQFFKFHPDTKGKIRADRIDQSAVFLDIVMRGKVMKWASGQKGSITINSYGELFVIDREYLTVDEAKDLKKNPPEINASTFTAPENAPAIPAETQALKDAVIKASKKSEN